MTAGYMSQKNLYEARAKIIKAMAHPTRLFIVEELAKGDRSVGELTEMIGADLSTVSKHLSVLKSSGILADERNGNTIIYRLKTPCILNFIGCVEEVIKTNAEDHRELSMCCRRTSPPPPARPDEGAKTFSRLRRR